MILKDDKIAIIGASNNPLKYGHIVMKDLLSKGYDVVPINLDEKEILGKKVYKNLREVGKEINAVIFIVPPSVTEKILEDVKEIGIREVWMQPGSESKKAIEFCEKNGINCTHNSCIMLR